MRATLPQRSVAIITAAIAITALAGCSLSESASGDDTRTTASGGPTRVVLVTHDSFTLPAPLVAAWEKRSGYTLVRRASGDAGTLTNKLVLTKDRPTGDVAFGVDNTFASRALEAGVFAPTGVDYPVGVAPFALPGAADRLMPVDNANVCINVDTAWFASRKLTPPRTLDDLTKPAYKGMAAIPAAATSSPGMAFLLTTIAQKGDGWQAYWSALMRNDIKLTSGWSDAYEVDFTAGGGKGKRPIVLSYDSSPAFTVSADGKTSSTRALLETCFRQVEYAGVLNGAKNPEGARSLIEFLVSPGVQAALPQSMYVFPVRAETPLPTAWARFAVQPQRPAALDPAQITANRDRWLRQWTDVTTR